MKFVLAGLLFLSITPACQSEAGREVKVSGSSDPGKVEVYYFHLTRRCATCLAVEDVTRELVESYQGKAVTFTSYNIEEKEGKAKAGSFNISGQTLLVVCGEKQINLTNEAFLYARQAPEKYRDKLRQEIDRFLAP